MNRQTNSINYYEIPQKYEMVKNFYLGIYYILKKNDYEKGVTLLKPTKDNNFYYANKYSLSLEQPIDNDKLRKEVETIKNVILGKRETSNVVFEL